MLQKCSKLLAAATILMEVIGVPLKAHADGPAEYSPDVCAFDTEGNDLSQACADMIKTYPKPDFEPVEQDKVTLDHYSFWKVGNINTATDLYDKPNGAVVGQIPQGFDFVDAVDTSVDGWLQIKGGHWLKRGTATQAKASFFSGVKLKDGLKYPFAWVLDKSNIYVSEYPGGPASSTTGRFLKRYELVNIFATADDKDGWHWYMIGPNQWVKQTFMARAHTVEKPAGVSKYWIAVDLYEQTVVAYADDKPFFATLASTGTPPKDTNEGIFKVWARLDHDSMSGATGAPKAYALQTIPWVMYFDNGISLHGTYWHDLFGYRTSHGCVNLSISDAAFLYKWMVKLAPDANSDITVNVYVYSSGKYGNKVIRDK